MYDYFSGKLSAKTSTTNITATIECGGIGYLINVNNRTLAELPPLNEQVKLYVSLIHKEDSMSLCGFIHKEDRDIFNILQSVSGVGMKMALTLLDEFSGFDLISAVIKEDSKLISTAKGIGPKLAQKIILELKDKLINWQKNTPINIVTSKNVELSNDNIFEAQSVLLSLGYSIEEAKKALEYAVQNCEKQDNSEELLKISLEYLSKFCS
ncbi:Holliday junction branch migration protein RuvA [bacterium]|nr:Holliday junction branch migration protein RuvA [bacterium]